MTQVLFEAALKATVMLVLVFGVALLLRNASAAARHTVWSSGFAGLLALPFLATTLPWRLEILPATVSTATISLPSDAIRHPPSAIRAGVAAGPQTATTDGGRLTADGAVPDGAVPDGGWRMADGAIALWIAGATLIVGRLLLGWILMMWISRRGQRLEDPSWVDLLDAAERRMDITTHVRLVKSDNVPMPMTSGWLRPVVVLPADCETWTSDRREAVLLHELAHVRRGDLWVHMLVQAALAIYWFHPMAWSAARRLRSDSERACDDLVLEAGTRASEYAGHLLQLVRRAGPGRAPAIALPMAQRSDFEGRLLAILEPTLPRRPLAPLTAIATAITVAFLAVPLAAMSPARAEVVAPEAAAPAAQATPTPTPTPKPTPRPSPQPMVTVKVDGNAIAKIAEEAARNVTQVIADYAPHIAQRASSAAVKGLVTAMADVDIEVRRNAAHALGNTGTRDTAAINALVTALSKDTDPSVRKTAAWALGEIEDARAVPALVNALKADKDVEVRKTAAWALGEIESPTAIDGLGAAMRDPEIEVRKNAVWALGEIEDARAVPVLVPFLKDANVEIRKTAVWALGEIESSTAIEALTPMVKDADVEVRQMAVWALGEIEDPRAATVIAPVLADANAGVRQKAAWALGEIDARQAPPQLIAALKDSDREVRKTAAWALGEIGDPAAVPGLSLMLKDSDNEIRRTALWALGEIGDDTAYDAIVAALKDGDPEVRRSAAQALGKRH